MKKEEDTNDVKNDMPVCGIIMPISSIDNCTSEHWAEVKKILSEAICDAGYKPKLVSDADDSGIIQKRIIQNIYDNDIVVCDVSGKNPNVMFELGLRLAFDKPAIIVIDDKTNYSFDTSPIEHISYPRDLRYYNILSFKEQLKTKIIGTLEKVQKDPNYTTFLKNFGEFEVAHVEKKEGSINDVVLSRLDDITQQLSVLQRRNIGSRINNNREDINDKNIRARDIIKNEIDRFCRINNVNIADIFFNQNGEKDRLFSQLENNLEIRHLCGNSERLRNLLDDNLAPF